MPTQKGGRLAVEKVHPGPPSPGLVWMNAQGDLSVGIADILHAAIKTAESAAPPPFF